MIVTRGIGAPRAGSLVAAGMTVTVVAVIAIAGMLALVVLSPGLRLTVEVC